MSGNNNANTFTTSHSHSHGHSHGNGEGHSHGHTHSPSHSHSHTHTHSPSHSHSRRIFLPRARFSSRRAFLGNVGKGTIALAVFAPILAACSSDGEGTAANTGQDNGDSSSDTSQAPDQETTAEEETASDGGGSDDALRWARANLGFVSAYVLARGNKAAIVDTGTSGSLESIGETLGTLGLNYGDVEHVILTHHHGDHVGSITEVMAEATSATVYAGEPDVPKILARGIVPLVGGEDIFGLEAVPTPGHTPGHMAVIDHTSGLLIAGDAIFTEGGGVVEGPERFFSDVPQSRETIREMAELSFDTLLVGHGEPIEGNADTAVADLAASLP